MSLLELYIENSAVNTSDTQPPITDQTWESWFNQWLEILHSHLPTTTSYEIGLRLTDDGEIQQLNHQYRQQNQPTDVLSFAALEANLPQNAEILASIPLYLGDIVISLDTAKRQAEAANHSFSTELAWLAAHGLLHLLGWDHPDEKTLVQMLKQQLILLQTIDINIDIDLE